MHKITSFFRRTQGALMAVTLGLLSALSMTTAAAGAQTNLSADPQVRATQQWEDILLLEAFDYLRITPQQAAAMQPLADYARTRMDEVEQQRARLQKVIQEQHQALLKGQHPTNADQADVLDKQREMLAKQELVSREIVNRLSPKLGAILTRTQAVRAWLLLQNHTPASEPKRVALTDVGSGFVFPQLEARDAIEDMVKTSLRQTYPADVIEQALTPWEFASLAGLAGPGGFGGGGAGGGAAADRAKALQFVQEMDPRMGQRMLMLGQKMLKQFTGGDAGSPPPMPVPQETRAAINRDAAAIRKSIETDPEAYLGQAHGDQMLDALKPLTRRLFLSARIKDALTARIPK